jgi:hypothetical protein
MVGKTWNLEDQGGMNIIRPLIKYLMLYLPFSFLA